MLSIKGFYNLVFSCPDAYKLLYVDLLKNHGVYGDNVLCIIYINDENKLITLEYHNIHFVNENFIHFKKITEFVLIDENNYTFMVDIDKFYKSNDVYYFCSKECNTVIFSFDLLNLKIKRTPCCLEELSDIMIVDAGYTDKEKTRFGFHKIEKHFELFSLTNHKIHQGIWSMSNVKVSFKSNFEFCKREFVTKKINNKLISVSKHKKNIYYIDLEDKKMNSVIEVKRDNDDHDFYNNEDVMFSCLSYCENLKTTLITTRDKKIGIFRVMALDEKNKNPLMFLHERVISDFYTIKPLTSFLEDESQKKKFKNVSISNCSISNCLSHKTNFYCDKNGIFDEHSILTFVSQTYNEIEDRVHFHIHMNEISKYTDFFDLKYRIYDKKREESYFITLDGFDDEDINIFYHLIFNLESFDYWINSLKFDDILDSLFKIMETLAYYMFNDQLEILYNYIKANFHQMEIDDLEKLKNTVLSTNIKKSEIFILDLIIISKKHSIYKSDSNFYSLPDSFFD